MESFDCLLDGSVDGMMNLPGSRAIAIALVRHECRIFAVPSLSI